MIKLQFIGRLGKDAQVNNVNGKTVINFNVAHSEKYKDSKGEQHEKTTWVGCAYWTERTAIVPYLAKGTLVYVEGTPDVKVYEGNGQLVVRVISVQLLSKATPIEGANNSMIDDLPF